MHDRLKRLLYPVFATFILVGCATHVDMPGIDLAGYSDIDLASYYAVKTCVNFYDESNGTYEIRKTNEGFVYIGMPKPRTRLHEGTLIKVDKDKRLVFVSADESSVYPKDFLNANANKAACKKYLEYHDSRGRELKPGWVTYD